MSYGFRPKRSAKQAIEQAKQYVKDDREWVVDLDLEKFFDTVNHDILMSLLAKQIQDKELLKLIRRFLTAGVYDRFVLYLSFHNVLIIKKRLWQLTKK